jgi:hypothetical protein
MPKEKNELQRKYELRLWSNKKILEFLADFAEKNPDLRFWQIMSIFGYETNPDRFYEESYDTYRKLIGTFDKNHG